MFLRIHGWTIKLIVFLILLINFGYFVLLYKHNVVKDMSNGLHNTKMYQKVLMNKFYRDKQDLITDLKETTIDINVPNFIDDSLIDSWFQRNETFYDPRLTLSIYLDQMRKILKKGPLKGRVPGTSRELKYPSITFNWVDWVDVTVLNNELHTGRNCKTIDNSEDTSHFCLNSPDQTLLDKGYTAGQIPGFIIHSHQNQGSENLAKVLQAKSYLMTNMPNPYKIVVLSAAGGTYEFDIDQTNSKRMLHTNMIKDFATENCARADCKINHLDSWKSLNNHKPKVTEKGHKYHETGKSGMNLSPELFKYTKSNFKELVDFYDTLSFANSLGPIEGAYHNSLRISNSYQGKDDEPEYFKSADLTLDFFNVGDTGAKYDWRFFNGALEYTRNDFTEDELKDRRNAILERLLRNWFRFSQEIGIVSWITRSSLLSWYRNGLIFPFAEGIDVQVPIYELNRLAREYNQTLVVEDPSEGYGKYLLDIGTFIHNRGVNDKNQVDARFIDVDSGVFIDIRALSVSGSGLPLKYFGEGSNLNKTSKYDEGIYNDRNGDFYSLEQLTPLRPTLFNGVPVHVPYLVTQRLLFEYGAAITSNENNGWYFVPNLNLWITQDYADFILGPGKHRVERQMRLALISEEETVQFLNNYDHLLTEYYLTRPLTDVHTMEKELLFDSVGLDKDHQDEAYYDLISTFEFGKPMRKGLFETSRMHQITEAELEITEHEEENEGSELGDT